MDNKAKFLTQFVFIAVHRPKRERVLASVVQRSKSVDQPDTRPTETFYLYCSQQASRSVTARPRSNMSFGTVVKFSDLLALTVPENCN